MSGDSQIQIPPSFIALFVPPGRSRPQASRDEILARHEFCEDLASALTETAANQLWELGVTEADVLDRIHRGLLADPALLAPAEAGWVVCRLAEMLNWALPDLAGPGDPARGAGAR